MKKIWDFVSKWAFAGFLSLIALTLLFSVACGIYTAVENPTVGIIGIIGTLPCFAVIIGWLCIEIKEGKNDSAD